MAESRSRVTARRRTDGLARTCCRTNHGDRAFRASPDPASLNEGPAGRAPTRVSARCRHHLCNRATPLLAAMDSPPEGCQHRCVFISMERHLFAAVQDHEAHVGLGLSPCWPGCGFKSCDARPSQTVVRTFDLRPVLIPRLDLRRAVPDQVAEGPPHFA